MSSTDLLAGGALLSGLAGIIAAMAALVRARSEARTKANAECEQRVVDALAAVEKTADAMSTARVRRSER